MDPQPAPPTKRLTLKLSGLGSSSVTASTISASTPGGGVPSAMSPPPATPSQGPTKIKLVRKSLPPTPADGVPPSLSILPSLNPASVAPPSAPAVPKIPKTQAGRQPKPSAKKRSQAESDDDVPLANGKNPEPKPKKHKITLKPSASSTGKLPTVKVKTAGRIPTRPLGEGYDSEAEDREVDPVIEEQFLLRMLPGEHCEYLRKAVNEKKVGIPKSLGGADISMKFLDDEGRRVMFVIQGQPYAAILLDLPTITEGMKTWDKKSMVKSADICQMLLVFAPVQNEEEARTAPLPKAVEHGHRWPHGITPPMHDARNRRFRKRLSKLEIQNKEAEVERLLAADRDAMSTKYEFVDERQTQAPEQESGEEYEEEEEDADGEADDYFGDAELGKEDENALFEVDDALLEAEFMDAVETPGGPTDLATPAVGVDAVTPATANTGTPAAPTEDSGQEGDGADEESGDDDDDDDGEDDGEDVDDGGDEERHDEVAGVKAEIAALKKQLAQYEEQLAKSTMHMMRKRIESSIKNVKSEIKLKQSAIGEVDED